MSGSTNSGGQSSSPFGSSQSVFEQQNNSSSNPFAPKPFGTPTPLGSQTGNSAGVFGLTQTLSPFSPNTTSSASSSPAFDSSMPAFGVSSTPTFGNSLSSFAGLSFGPFGSTSTPAFGATTVPTFVSIGNAFGMLSAPVFGGGGAFGASSNSPVFCCFYYPNSPAFGASTTPTFGQSSSAFGTSISFAGSSAPVFGGERAFVASSSPVFGSSSTSAFGASSSPVFSFGSSTQACGQSCSAFGSHTPTQTFENTGIGQSEFGPHRGGSRVASYSATATTEPDVDTGKFGKFASISTMLVYKDRSHEELRWEDYQLGDKGGPFAFVPLNSNLGGPFAFVPQSTAFGQSSSRPFGSSQSVFGQQNNSSNNPSASKPSGSPAPLGLQTGKSSTSAGVFGATQTLSPFSSNTTSSASSSLAFNSSILASGASSTPAFGSSVFDQKPAFGGFGSTPTQTSPFGNATQPSQPAFGSNTQQSQPAFGRSIFGSSTPFGASSQPAFGSTGTPAFGATSTPAFGQSSTSPFSSTPPNSTSPASLLLQSNVPWLKDICQRVTGTANFRAVSHLNVADRSRLFSEIFSQVMDGLLFSGALIHDCGLLSGTSVDELSSLRARVKHLEGESGNALLQEETLKKEVKAMGELNNKLSMANKDLADARKKVTTLGAHNETLSEKVKTLEEHNKSLSEKIYSLELAIYEHGDPAVLKKELAEAHGALASKETTSHDKDEELVNLRNVKASLEKELYDSLDNGTSVAKAVFEDAIRQVEKGLSVELDRSVYKLDEGGNGDGEEQSVAKDLVLTGEELQNFALAEIEKVLQSTNTSLKDFPSMPQPDMSLLSSGQNRLIQDELNYDRQALVIEHEKLVSSMTSEQSGIYNKIYAAVSRVTSRAGLKILIIDDDGNATNKTSNVVYKEVFQNMDDV